MSTSHADPLVIVLAAGAGTRMRSATPKVLHPIGGCPLIAHALAAVQGLKPAQLVVVIRHAKEVVAAAVAEVAPEATVVEQDATPGTGSATKAALAALQATGQEGTVVITYADVPLLSTALLAELLTHHTARGHAVTAMSAELGNPTGYGRIIRDQTGAVTDIREERDASESEKALTEVNTGIYAVELAVLERTLAQLHPNNAQGELYLTDIVRLAAAAGHPVGTFAIEDTWQVQGVNDRVQLAQAGIELNRRTLEQWMRAGATILDPATTWVDVQVQLAEDVTLLPGTQLHGQTIVARGARIGPDCTLTDVRVGERAHIIRTHASGAVIEAGALVGPYSYLRPGTVLGRDGKIGAFYETKNVRIGERSKLSHLGYAGDTDIGPDTNIGCGNITANYDGARKHRTSIGRGVRTGSGTIFVAPVQVGDGAYSAAGTVIREDVPPGALAFNPRGQEHRPNWVGRNRPDSISAQAAAEADATATQAPGAPEARASDDLWSPTPTPDGSPGDGSDGTEGKGCA